MADRLGAGRPYRYGRWSGGPDPLAPPYDVGEALDRIGDDVLSGATPDDALRDLLRRGGAGLRGLTELRRQARRRIEQLRRSGRLDGTLERVRRLLDQALEAERLELFRDPDDGARLEETELDALPQNTASAVRALADRQWRSPTAREAYGQIEDLLRTEILDAQFAGLKQALSNRSPEAMQQVKDMLADLNRLLAKHAVGADTEADLADFLDKHGEFFPDRPASVDELIDQLARRAAAAQRMMAGLSDDQRAELSALIDQALGGDLGLAAEMDRLTGQLQAARPDLDWDSDPRMTGERGPGLGPGLGDATAAVAELSDLEALERSLGQSYPGAELADIDEDLVATALGRQAVDDVAALRRVERELAQQGWLTRRDGHLELSPRAVRRLGSTALRRVFARIGQGGRGGHDDVAAGAAGEATGSSRRWEFGDTQPIDVVRTVGNAVRRSGVTGGPVRLDVDDFEIVETERRSRAAVALLVDLSYSMALNDTWGPAKSTALALHALVGTRFPQDAMQIIGFSQYARTLRPAELAGLDFDPVQGTNLQHALMLAGRFLRRHPDAEPVVLVVTDGEPTAHLERSGRAAFAWPPQPETVARTLAEVDRATRAGVTLNVFMLGDEPRLVAFMREVARRNGGRLFTTSGETLGEHVVQDYLRSRSGSRS